MLKLRKILLAEDNYNDVELTLEAFSEQNLGNRVVTVNDGVEALEYLLYEGKYVNREKEYPAFILLDIKMPRMDGIEVLKAVKDNSELKKIPIVMLTSSREDSDLQKCYNYGVNAYVVKPVNFKDFMAAVKEIGVFWTMINELPINGG